MKIYHLSLIISIGLCAVDIHPGYLYYSTNFTNNGGMDNSSCDITLNGLYMGEIDPATSNYAGFAMIESDPSQLVANQLYDVADKGFECLISAQSGTQTWACFEAVADDSSIL